MGSNPGQRCFTSLDGTDYRIEDPMPFDPKWYSHKFKAAGLQYEVGICIETCWIVWVNGPFPCGEWPDVNIAQLALHGMLDNNEMYVADGVY
ncbi:hypothetical protein ACA910_018966 [Epithemia clementina (nom. ined.)]